MCNDVHDGSLVDRVGICNMRDDEYDHSNDAFVYSFEQVRIFLL